jgi:hypothetical protein
MPTKPKIVNLNPDVSKMLNAIRTNASQTYQDRIPVATQENIREVGNAILQFYATQNEFLNALVNRIARVLITSKMYSNPLKRFKKGTMEYGETIEEVFVNIANAQQFDPEVAEKEVFKREIPDVNAVFHRRNYENFFKVTISEQQLRAAFLSQQGISDLIARIVDSLYSGSEFDEFLIMKQLIADAAAAGRMYPVKVPVPSAASAKEIVTKIKGISNKLEFMSSIYNPYGVLTVSKKNEQILIIDAEFDAMIDVEVLASAFNMSKAEFMGQRVLIDNFANLTGVVAALVDESFFMVFDNLIEFTEQYNAQGLYWNYFLHVWKTFSTSPFATAILFLITDIAVTGVTVTPAAATVHKGSNIVLTANVAGTGYPPSEVTWAITGNTSNKTYISPYGVLYIGDDETTDTITVTATSDYDKSMNGTSTITVE